MTEISIKLIQELRAHTGVGIDKCKKALKEANGDIDLAITNLRKAGMASAVKKEAREAKEGMIVSFDGDNAISLVEVNAETDFVIQNDTFQDFAKNIAEEIAMTKPKSPEDFLKQKYSKDNSISIDEYRASVVHSLGENIQIKRFTTIDKNENISTGVYSHMGGKIVCVVEIEGSKEENALAREIALHSTAEMPLYISPDEVSEEMKKKEEEIAREQIKDKPADIIEKIITGKMRSFYDQVCLLNQKFVRDPDVTIAQLLEKHGKEKGATLSIRSFVRWKVGE